MNKPYSAIIQDALHHPCLVMPPKWSLQCEAPNWSCFDTSGQANCEEGGSQPLSVWVIERDMPVYFYNLSKVKECAGEASGILYTATLWFTEKSEAIS